MRLVLTTICIVFITTVTFAQKRDVTGAERNLAIDIGNKAIEKIQNQEYKAAFPLIKQTIQLDSTLRKPYLYLYTIASKCEEYRDSSLCLLNKAYSLFQEDDEICYYIGEIYRMKGELNKAFLEYSKAISYSKKNGEELYLVPHYYFNRASISLQKKRLSSAVIDYSYAIKLKPGYTAAYVNRGICWFQMGRKEDACTDWKSGMDLGSDYAKECWEKNCEEKK
ncbi:hypothetical protein [Marinifilum fragile]|uniref:hypothetical protein n=1 Tax=Marinifilum fragile TaxID=570161 RepID=UPI002AA6FAFF|nr:hypothetical protein [Marinifilum fragile]